MKLNIRRFEQTDVKDLAEIYSYPSVTENTSQVPFLSSSDVEKFFQSPTDYILVAELDNKVIGHVSLILSNKPREKHSASLAIAVHPDSHGKGVGRKLLTEAINQADNWLNLLRLELEVYPENEAALSLYEKFGFQIEGEKKSCSFKAGKFSNLLILARLNMPV
ncbi:GNAT family N-acetyltransferase [Pseudocolwellia sp. HL-MZ7]|uniref:GNAT family N-acetyltransferase n=1 Tax=Pseudocolwellia sp. HL-MZ7 TaxID=3400627 RepID=UPI003CE6AC2C